MSRMGKTVVLLRIKNLPCIDEIANPLFLIEKSTTKPASTMTTSKAQKPAV
jgi:hypothetical protein